MIVLKPKVILRHVQEGEEIFWIKSDLTSLEGGAESKDTATTLVRKSQLVRQIHQYFGSLEPRKCCLALSGCKTSFTNVRLVRNDGRDSGIEEGAMFRSPADVSDTIRDLTAQEERVFRRAYLCASYPVLCAPEPPSPLSPSPVVPQGSKKFQFKGQLTIARPPTPDDSGLEDDMTVVPADTLFELLRRTFHLTQEKFQQFEHQIYRYHQKKDPSRILAEELVGQLALLENNVNPSYNPESFMSPSGYDSWQRKEFSHIANLLKKFWHSAFPPLGNNYKQNQRGILEDYTTLLHKLLRYESPYRVEGELLAPGLSCLLSSASVRLLKEFGLRYGIRELYRKLVYLQYLTSNFVPSTWFIQHTCTSLSSVLDMLPNSGASHVLLKTEYDILEESLNALEKLCKSNLCKMKSLFPQNRPSDGLDSLIYLVTLTQKGLQYLVSRKGERVENILKTCVQSIFPVCYEEHKVVAIKDLHQKDSGLSPTLMNKMICKIRDEVKDYKDNYQSTFEKYFDITVMAAESLYNLLMTDVATVCQSQPKSSYIDKCMLGLAYRLSQLDQAWGSYIPEELQTWRNWFETEQLYWAELLKDKLIRLIQEGISKDKFEGFIVEDIHSIIETPVSSLVGDRIRSLSSKSITPSINSAFSGMSSLHSTPLHSNFTRIHRQNSTEKKPIPGHLVGNHVGNSPGPWYGKMHISSSAPGPLKDTQSLCEFSEEDEGEDGVMTFSNLRHSSSVPEMLSKSYDHHLDVIRTKTKVPDMLGNLNGDNFGKELATDSSINSVQQQVPLSNKEDPRESLQKSQSDSEQEDEIVAINENNTKVTSEQCSTRGKQDSCDKSEDETPKQIDPHQQLLNENAMTVDCNGPEGRADGDQDSLAGEFTQSFGEEDRVERESLSSVQDSPVQNFDFPPVSEVVTLDSEKLTETNAVPPTETVHAGTNDTEETCNDSSSTRGSREAGSSSGMELSSPENQTSSSDVPSSLASVRSAYIPVSSSLFDVLVLLQRTVGFGKTLCQTFYKSIHSHRTADLESSFSSSTTAGSYFGGETTRKKLYIKFHEVVCSTLTIYADNILCLDLCGTTRSEGLRLVGAKMVNHLHHCKQSQKIWGCRHQILGINNCFQYVNKQADMLCDRYEPVSQAMCIRMNIVSSLMSYSDIFFKKLASAFNYEWSHVSPAEFYGLNNGGSPSSMESCRSHLKIILRSLARLLAYRLNLFAYDAMIIFLSLRDSRRSVAASLAPLSEFLGSYIDLLNQWLYRDNFHVVMENLWIFIVQNFEKEIIKLAQNENSQEAAKQLVQAFTTLLKLMSNKDAGIQRGHLLSQAESVMFKLQIYTTASNQLIQLYEKLMEHYYGSDTVSICTLDGTVKTILHKIRDDLLVYRKCFSGSHLITWIMKHPELFYQFDPELENTENSRERRWTAISIAETLLRSGVIVDLDAEEEPEFEEEDDEIIAFPEISIAGEHGASYSYDGNYSCNNTPRATPVPHGKDTPVPPRKDTPRPVVPEESQRPLSPKKRSLHQSLHAHFRGTPVLQHRQRSHDPHLVDGPHHGILRQVDLDASGEHHHQPITPSLHQSLRTQVLTTPIRQTQSCRVQRSHSAQAQLGEKEEQEKSCLQKKDGEVPNKRSNSGDSVDKDTPGSSSKVENLPVNAHLDYAPGWNLPFCATPNLHGSVLDSSFQESEFQFEDSRRKFYRIASFADSLPQNRSPCSEELSSLVEKCFEIKIIPEFVFRILLSRKNFDDVARNYLASHPEGKHGDFVCEIS